MTVQVLVTGEIFRAAKQQTSKAGKVFTVATMKAAATDASNSEFWSVLAFSDTAQQELLRLTVGEKLSVQGGLKLETFTRDDGEVRISRTIFANAILPLRAPPREKKPKPAPPSAPLQSVNIMPAAPSDLDDDIPF